MAYRSDVAYLSRFFLIALGDSGDEFDVEFEVALRTAASVIASYQFHEGSCPEADIECRRIRNGVDARIEACDQRERGVA